jgi:hypothetical protein
LSATEEREESDQTSVRNGEPSSAVDSAEDRLGTLRLEEAADMGNGETRRVGRGLDLIDPFN